MPGAILGTEDEAEEKKIVVVIVKPWLLWGLHPSWGRQVHTNRMNGHLWCWCSGVGGNMGTGGLPLTFPSDSPRFAHRWSAVSLNGCLSAHCLPHQDAEDTLLQRNSTVLSPFPSPPLSSPLLFSFSFSRSGFPPAWLKLFLNFLWKSLVVWGETEAKKTEPNFLKDPW